MKSERPSGFPAATRAFRGGRLREPLSAASRNLLRSSLWLGDRFPASCVSGRVNRPPAVTRIMMFSNNEGEEAPAARIHLPISAPRLWKLFARGCFKKPPLGTFKRNSLKSRLTWCSGDSGYLIGRLSGNSSGARRLLRLLIPHYPGTLTAVAARRRVSRRRSSAAFPRFRFEHE